MRAVLLFLAVALCAFAQSERVTYTFDLNGRRVPAESSSKDNGASRELTRNVNGRTVPLESTEEKVLSTSPDGRIVERFVTQFDASGRPATTTKIRVEERKSTDGATTTVTTVYDSTLNGGYALRERSTAQTSLAGNVTQTQTVAERPSLNGSFEVVEKRTVVAEPARHDVTIFRRDAGGRFTLSEREVAVIDERNGVKTVAIDKYNSTATGKLDLAGQQVRRIETRPDGSEIEVVDVFGAGVGNYSDKPTLREQQIIERKPGAGLTLTEVFSIRRPEMGSGKLGPAQTISETVCTGKCR